jgi:hypothetical protein
MKDDSNFYKNKAMKEGLSHYCKECDNERGKKYINKEAQKKRSKRWYENNRSLTIERAIKWEKENKEKHYLFTKNYKRKNPEIYTLNKNKRRAKQKETDITMAYLKQLKEETENCPLCGAKLNNINYHPNQYHLDHIIPIGINGKHMKNNVRYICGKCNLARPRNGSDLVEAQLGLL